MTSRAITPPAPCSSAATRPAAAWRRTPAQAAANGSRRLARKGDDRVVALQHDDGVRALRGLLRAAQPPPLDVVARRAEQAGELAGVRRQHGRRRALRERVERPGVGVEPVGVEQQRDGRARRERAHEGDRRDAAPHAGTEHERPRAGGRLERGIDTVRHEHAVVVRHPVCHDLEQPRLEDEFQ
jgi:hypothetical protein